MWCKIYDVIIKSLITVEDNIRSQSKKNNVHRTNCFELFGYDILVDQNLKYYFFANFIQSMAPGGESIALFGFW